MPFTGGRMTRIIGDLNCRTLVLAAFAVVLSCGSAYSATIYQDSITLIRNGTVTPFPPGGVSIPPDATVKVVTDPTGTYTVVVVTETSPNTNNNRIVTENGQVIEIPDGDNIDSVTESDGKVTVTYKDGSTATVPGKHLPPGEPNPTEAAKDDGEVAPDSESTTTGAEAQQVIEDVLGQDYAEDLFGGPIDISDFAFPDPFPIGQGLINIDYPDGSRDTIAVSPVPVPAAFWMLSTALIGLAGLRKRALASR
jgi:hypothetical protein